MQGGRHGRHGHRREHGRGTFGSRSTSVVATGLRQVADRLIEKGKIIAAHLLEASPDDTEFADGRFTIAGTDLAVTFLSSAS